ncbi:MAG: enoyl-CoA hydratase/isomerase family protein [Phycisphaerales bacterium]|nr:enoyl-CoA hydratase/isomerase family protein [Phycisphaerales bacterium]
MTVISCQLRQQRCETGVITLWLDNPERDVAVLDQWLLEQIHSALDLLSQDQFPKGLILRTSGSRAFIAGADLAEIDSLSDERLAEYLRFGSDAFHRIADLPYPTVAAIDGATLGGGLELAMHCDALIASRPDPDRRPYHIGLPEASLGLCPGWGGTQLLPARMNPSQAICMAATGVTVPITEAPDGLITTMVDRPEDLQAAATKWILANGNEASKGPKSFSCRDQIVEVALAEAKDQVDQTDASEAVFLAVQKGLEIGWDAGLATEQKQLIQLRSTTVAKAKLDSFLHKPRS